LSSISAGARKSGSVPVRAGEPRVHHNSKLPIILGIVAFLLSNPGIIAAGRANIAFVAITLLLISLLVADRQKLAISRTNTAMLLLMTAVTLWVLIRAASQANPGSVVTGAVLTMISLAAFSILFGKEERVITFARLVLIIIALASLSSVLTLLTVAASKSIVVGTLNVRELTSTIYFPYTPTLSTQDLFGLTVPRFTGIAREPGWMSMFAAAAWFLWPAAFLGTRSAALKILRLSLLGGVLTPISTAGFGIFVVVAACTFLLNPAKRKSLGTFKIALAVAAVSVSIWFAIHAPVFGLEAKPDQNAGSLEERTRVTSDGLNALVHLSLGEQSMERTPNINMIAAVTENGWPYILLLALALIVPLLITKRDSMPVSAPVVAIVFLTLLFSQPPGGSVGAYVVALLALALGEHHRKSTVSGQSEDWQFQAHIRQRSWRRGNSDSRQAR